MGFGALVGQAADRNWSFLLLLHDPCHRAPLYLLEGDYRSLPHTAGPCLTVTCPSLKDEYFDLCCSRGGIKLATLLYFAFSHTLDASLPQSC